ncbi:shikimate dehydrogenase [Nesterenkonia suensis]
MAGTRAAVLGHPIDHSLSPALHSAAYRLLGVEIDYSRCALDVDRLPQFLAGPGAEADWVGWSVTMPLKSAMVEHMDSVSARVRALGVLNTVIHGPDGRHGENTDVDGIVAALGEAGLHGEGADREVFGVIGAGSTAVAALAAAAELGAEEIRVYARSLQRAGDLEPLAEKLGLRLSPRQLELIGPDLADDALAAVVSTLPPRAADGLAGKLPRLPRRTPLLDVAYDPWPSALARAWEQAGGQVISGLAMLLHQAVRQVELFTASSTRPAGSLSAAEHRALVAEMRAALPA